jgi:integrase/recombinase XerD
MKENALNKQQIDSYRDHLVREEHSPETIKKYVRDVQAFFEFLPADKTVSKEAVMAYKQRLGERYRISSANSMLAALRSFLQFIGRGECRVKLFRMQRSTFRDRAKELSRQEYARLIKAAQLRHGDRLALLIQTICSTGIRVSEHRFITVESLKAGNAQITNKGRTRTIVLPKELCRRLLQYCGKRGICTGPVFLSRGGRPMNRSNIWAQMKQLCGAAGVAPEKVFPHNLRHLFALTFYRLEKDIVRLADILGHASVETTRIYTFTCPEEHARALSKMHLLL